MTRKSTTLDLAAPVKAIRALSGKSHQSLGLAAGYLGGRGGHGSASSIQTIEAAGGRVLVSTVQRIADAGAVRLDARARRGAGPWAALALDALGDVPVTVEAMCAVCAMLGVRVEIRATREDVGAPITDAVLGALGDMREEQGRPVEAHLVREVLAEGRAKPRQS